MPIFTPASSAEPCPDDNLHLTRVICNTISIVTQRGGRGGRLDAAPQELVMTVLGAYLRPRDRQVWSGGLVALLGEFGSTSGAARVALARLAARGMLARRRAGRLVHYTLTQRAAAILAEGDRRIFSLGREGRDQHGDAWTVLWHTIPESRRLERSRLTRWLRFLGFGPLQDGTWLAPGNHEPEVNALLAELGVRDHVAVLIGRPAGVLDLRSFVSRAWNLDEVTARYRKFVAEYGEYAAPAVRAALADAQALQVHTRLVHTFRQFPFLDPDLPANLVPAPEHRAPAVQLFHDVYDALVVPAQRHFDQVTTP
jgi:phenylacetic acid degradation operon negative regulatory protein